jgi:filamentous hemagglutinin family protein
VNKDETPMGLYTAVGDSNSRLDFSGTGALKLGGETYTVINSAEQLTAARSNPAGRYALGSDINAATMTNWTPLDNNATSGFTGKFNGLGHQIDNFKSTNGSLFGTLGSGAAVSNFRITNYANVTVSSANSKKATGLFSDVNRGNIVNVSIGGKLIIGTNIDAVGALTGVNYGLIAKSVSGVPISGITNTTGNLVGINESAGRIVDSYATGQIANELPSSPTAGYVGGLVGLNNGIIERSYAEGRILLDGATAVSLMVGGFTGKNAGTIRESYTAGSGSYDTAPRFGGFVGENSGLIENAYSTRLTSISASANWDAGFVYKNYGTIRNAYATMLSRNNNGVRYGFARENIGTLENVYWNAGKMELSVSEVMPTSGAIHLSQSDAGTLSGYNFGVNMSNFWGESKSGYPVLRNIPVTVRVDSIPTYGSATSSVNSLHLVATGLQGGGGNGDYNEYADNLSSYNPFTVTIPNGDNYLNAGVYNASDILTDSIYANINGVIRVNPKPLTISSVVADRTYDGTTTAVLKSGVAKSGLVGLVGSQTLDVAYTSAAFQNKDAGNGKVADIAYTVANGTNGGKISNYTLPATTTATITPKPVSVVIVGNDRVYDGTTAATVNTSVSGVIAGDELAATYQSAFFDSKDSGNRTVTVSGLSLTGDDSGNYTISGGNTATTSAAITPRPLQFYGVANEGGSLTVGADNLSAANVVEGDSVRLGGSVGIASSAAGSQPITNFSALTVNNPNYTVIGSVGSILIGGANLVFDRVTEGNATVAVSGKTTTVIQTTDKTSIDWLRFSLNDDESLEFKQPSSSSIVLNRVVTDLPSMIAGTLKANGRVFILNAGGVLFTAKSHVNVGALVASTFNLKDDDFLNNTYVFTVAQGSGSIISEGDIVIAENGFVALAGNHDVKHTGTISGGDAALFASTDSLTLNPEGRAVSPRPPLYTIGDLTGTTTVGGRVNIGSTAKGGELLTAGNTVAVNDGFTLNTGTGGAWVYDQNDAITIGAGRFTGSFVNDNLNTRNLSLRSREGDITVNAAVDWTANTTLGLSAKGDININKPIKATGATAGLDMDYGGDYHLITPATFSGAVLDATGKPVARQIPAGTEYSSITLSGANSKLRMNGNDYTVIRNMEEFAALSPSNADATGTATGYFALANDLDASAWSAAHTGTSSVVASMSGTLAGLGHTVDKLTLNAPSGSAIYGVGLIGRVEANNGGINVLRDIGVTNVDLAGNGGGALVYGAEDTTIRNAYSTGKIISQGLGAVGGLVGLLMYGSEPGEPMVEIESSYSGVDVTVLGDGAGRTGGLLGGAQTIVTIKNSHATGNVYNQPVTSWVNLDTGERIPVFNEFGRPVEPPVGSRWHIANGWARVIGGLVGGDYGNVINSYATGNVTSIDGEVIGGLVGIFGGEGFSVINSFATGNVTGGDSVGGLIGKVEGPGIVDNTYATGTVTGTRETTPGTGGMIGGLIGQSKGGNISNSYASGNVIAIAENPTGDVGGLVGSQRGGSINNSYATGTVVGNGGGNTGGLVGGSYGTVSDSYYRDATGVTMAELAPVRTEMGAIVDNMRLNESENIQRERKNTIYAQDGRNSDYLLGQYIYQDDDGYSARVKAISVEEPECGNGDDSCKE